ncbi:hypothetical protein SAMN02745121_03042 [Nannocystis exedens]|uniref:Delta-60 repeat domain-containing protein n=1 Tax=Nannocystis exedens TaxID=54 RepID=A0A1I1XSG1_9BACT|nr:hypothetical protein [Nannocystis exedens]PCC73231.1 hypothetical protein NAEX_06319 [Nannocystis exedens]SFE10191.1 hypothetical protein SAMN02745121_03042 [Nannocystis exedens]
MLRVLRRPSLAASACLSALLSSGCFDGAELAACGISMTYCDAEDGSAGGEGTVTTSSSTGPGIMTSDSLSGGSGGSGGSGDAGDSASEDTWTSGTTGELNDPPPWIDELACDPPEASEVGPTIVTYKASADAVEADLLDDGVVIATGPAGMPFVFPVTSGPANNPGSHLTVVVRDAGGQTAEASIYQPSVVKDPGSTVWLTLEQHDGMFSTGNAVALDGNNAIGAGVHWDNGQVLAILRRYDKSGTWIATSDGWTQKHTDWTLRAELKTGHLGLGGLAVDGDGNIIAVGTAQVAGEPRMYVARFGTGGGLLWEVLGPPGTEARGVGVTADQSIYVAGSVRVKKGPEVWDMATWVFSADKQAYGPDIFNDPNDLTTERSERGYAVAVLESGRVAVAGTREMEDPITNKQWRRGVVLIFEGKGKRIGEWTSPGDKMDSDAIFAAASSKEGLVVCGYAQNDPDNPSNKPQILIRWLSEDLSEVKAPRVEGSPGAATCYGIGTNMEGATIVGATVHENQGGDNAWLFAVKDAASPRVDYMKRNGASNGQDRVLALACEYMCAWTGSEEVEGAAQWIAGMIRG